METEKDRKGHQSALPCQFLSNNSSPTPAYLWTHCNGTLNVGIDSELMALGVELAIFYVEAGGREFSDFAKAIVSDLSETLGRTALELVPSFRILYLNTLNR